MSIKLGTKFDAFQKLGGTQLTWTLLMSCHFRLHISLKCGTKFDAFSELIDMSLGLVIPCKVLCFHLHFFYFGAPLTHCLIRGL